MVVERLMSMNMPFALDVIFSLIVGLIAAPVALVPEWTVAKKTAASLTILLASELIYVGTLIAQYPNRLQNVVTYVVGMTIDVAAVALAWFVFGFFENRNEPETKDEDSSSDPI
ncbi:MAG: hypothetical protein ABUL49_00950 [bacterium]